MPDNILVARAVDDIGQADDTEAVVALMTAFGHKLRVQIWTSLVSHGDEGLTAGAIAMHFQLPASSLSFHLQLLTRVGALRLRHTGRHTIYAVRPETLERLHRFISEMLSGNLANELSIQHDSNRRTLR